MKVVHSLSDYGHLKIFFQLGQHLVPAIRLHFEGFLSTLIIKIQNKLLVFMPAFWRCDFLNPKAFP